MRSEARIEVADPSALAARFIGRMSDYDIPFETRGEVQVADLERGHVSLSVGPRVLNVSVEGPDAGQVEMLRASVASYLVDFAEAPITVRWSGAAPVGALFENFRVARVAAVRDLTPRMRRLTLAVPDITRFASHDDIHVRLYIAPVGCTAPDWPRIGRDGRTMMPPPENRPDMRYYTVRVVDRAAGTLDIDMVLHTPGGPGCAFAERAVAGDVIGLAGPVGHTVKRAAWTLLAGDETALPAIARILETMPRDATGAAVIEVEDVAEEQPLTPPPGFAVRWLYRNGTPATLLSAMREIGWPDHDDVFVWAGCECAVADAIRIWLKDERGLRRDRQLVASYWSL